MAILKMIPIPMPMKIPRTSVCNMSFGTNRCLWFASPCETNRVAKELAKERPSCEAVKNTAPTRKQGRKKPRSKSLPVIDVRPVRRTAVQRKDLPIGRPRPKMPTYCTVPIQLIAKFE